MLQRAEYQSKTLSNIFFLVDCTTFNPIAHFGIPSVGLREDEIPSKQPLASATALKVRLPYRTVLTQGGKLIIHPVCCRILYSEFSRLILSIFGRV